MKSMKTRCPLAKQQWIWKQCTRMKPCSNQTRKKWKKERKKRKSGKSNSTMENFLLPIAQKFQKELLSFLQRGRWKGSNVSRLDKSRNRKQGLSWRILSKAGQQIVKQWKIWVLIEINQMTKTFTRRFIQHQASEHAQGVCPRPKGWLPNKTSDWGNPQTPSWRNHGLVAQSSCERENSNPQLADTARSKDSRLDSQSQTTKHNSI